jgi:hypothetical protein
MKIDFYIPKDQTIPTELRVKVDDTIDVYYERATTDQGWTFKFFKHQGVTLEMAVAITDEIFSRMVSQSYDHGTQWRERGVREIVNDEWWLSITVFYYVRDAG